MIHLSFALIFTCSHANAQEKKILDHEVVAALGVVRLAQDGPVAPRGDDPR